MLHVHVCTLLSLLYLHLNHSVMVLSDHGPT